MATSSNSSREFINKLSFHFFRFYQVFVHGNYEFIWTGFDWDNSILQTFDQPNQVAGEENVFYTQTEFNENNSHFDFLRKKFESACVVLKDVDLARPISFGDNPEAPVPIQ